VPSTLLALRNAGRVFRHSGTRIDPNSNTLTYRFLQQALNMPTQLRFQTDMFCLYLTQQYRHIWYDYLPLGQGVSTAHPVVIRRKIRARLPKELTYIGRIKSLDLSISYLICLCVCRLGRHSIS
jgi:hypothetical protein